MNPIIKDIIQYRPFELNPDMGFSEWDYDKKSGRWLVEKLGQLDNKELRRIRTFLKVNRLEIDQSEERYKKSREKFFREHPEFIDKKVFLKGDKEDSQDETPVDPYLLHIRIQRPKWYARHMAYRMIYNITEPETFQNYEDQQAR